MLAPYRIVDLGRPEAAFCGYLFSLLGADVVRSGPATDGADPRAVDPWIERTYGRHRRTLPAGTDLTALLADCDILIARGPDDDRLREWRAAHPRLITVSITTFGSTGPKAGWAGGDLVAVAAGGQMSLNGDDDRAPVRISVPQAFLHASAEGAFGALIALWERHRSGLGQHVDVSAQQCMMQATQTSMLAAAVGGAPYTRVAGGVKVGPYKLRFVYPAADGHVSITHLFGAAVGPFTARLMQWVHEEGFCDEATRDLDWVDFFALIFSGRVEPSVLQTAIASIAAFTSTKTKAELLGGALERRLLIAPVATTSDVLASEQLASRGFWDEVDGLRVPGRLAPIRFTPATSAPTAPTSPTVTAPVAVRGAAPTGDSLDEATARALDGLKVLDLSWAIAAPMATRVLADHGATVVRLETQGRPDAIRTAGPYLEGTGQTMEDTAQWHSVNAGKYGLQLDLGTDGGRAVAEDLVRWADVVVESFTPGTIDGWGLGYERLAEINPSVILVSSCLMGQSGPLSTFAGYGNLAAAITGFTEITGWPDRPPAGPFLAYTDYTSPRITLPLLLAALDHRRRTGEGCFIDFAQAEGALQFLAPALARAGAEGIDAARQGNDDPHVVPHGVYPCAGDDRWVAVACPDGAWATLADLLDRPELAELGHAERRARQRDLDEIIGAWTRTRDPEHVQQLLQDHGVPAHQVQNSAECVADPQLAHRQHFRRVPHGIHPSTVVEGPHLLLSRTPGDPRWGGPTLGQHTDLVLREFLGYDDDQITDLVISGAIT